MKCRVKRQPDRGADNVFMAFVGGHESAQHEYQAADECWVIREPKRTQVEVHEEAGQRVVDQEK